MFSAQIKLRNCFGISDTMTLNTTLCLVVTAHLLTVERMASLLAQILIPQTENIQLVHWDTERAAELMPRYVSLCY